MTVGKRHSQRGTRRSDCDVLLVMCMHDVMLIYCAHVLFFCGCCNSVVVAMLHVFVVSDLCN